MTIKRRAQSPHEALLLADKNGDAYYLRTKSGAVYDVASHGPEWVCMSRSDKKNAPYVWRRWADIQGTFFIEGDVDPYEMGEFP